MNKTKDVIASIIELVNQKKVCALQERLFENIQSEGKKEERNEERIWDLWNSIKRANVWVIGIKKGDETEKGIKSLFKEIIAKKFQTWRKI